MRAISITTKNILSPEEVEMMRKAAETNANDPENRAEMLKKLTANKLIKNKTDDKMVLNESKNQPNL